MVRSVECGYEVKFISLGIFYWKWPMEIACRTTKAIESGEKVSKDTSIRIGQNSSVHLILEKFDKKKTVTIVWEQRNILSLSFFEEGKTHRTVDAKFATEFTWISWIQKDWTLSNANWSIFLVFQNYSVGISAFQ